MLTEVQAGTEWRALQALSSWEGEHRALLPPCRTTEGIELSYQERYPGSSSPSATRWVAKEVQHPSEIHEAVHELYEVLRTKGQKKARLVEATLILHRAGFGLVVYRSPRPGCVQVFNKRFGEAPISLVDEPLPTGLLIKAVKEFV